MYILREKSLVLNFLTSLVFVYKSVSPRRLRIEQLCPSIDSMISLVFQCTVRHYVIVNLNVNEHHVQYVHSKTDDSPRVTQCTVRELSYRKHKNWGKIENERRTSFHIDLE